MSKVKVDFNDILIVPEKTTNINSRSTVNPHREGVYSDSMLPIITAPMDTVVSEKNIHLFIKNKINICSPRFVNTSLGFNSYSIEQGYDLLKNDRLPFGYYLIDVANGHMGSVLDLTKNLKNKHPHIKLMVGNIANPKTYVLLSEAGADYVRVGIGNGGGCFLENSIVSIKSGEKPIQDIEIGDYVLTHTGEYKQVISTIAYPSREELIKINETISTKCHEYYVLNKKYKDLVDDDNIHNYAEWIKAENLTNEYFLLEYEEND